MNNLFKKYRRFFTEQRFWNKCLQHLLHLSNSVLYTILLLFYAYKKKDTPYWAKNIVIGTLGYLISPIDAVPDLTPILGYTDDIGILSFGLITIACYIDMDVKIKARQKLKSWTGELDMKSIEEVDRKL